MSTRSSRTRPSTRDLSPPRTRKGVSPPRSPGRPRKTSPARPAVRKSPSRKSPSRKSETASKFPARKSPSRTTQESIEKVAQKSPSKRAAIKTDKVSVKLQDVTKLDIYRSTRSSRRIEYSIGDLKTENSLTSLDKLGNFNGVDYLLETDIYGLRNRRSVEEAKAPRRSGRIREIIDNVPDIRRSSSKSLSKSISKSVSQSIDTYSDEDNSEAEYRKKRMGSSNRKLATPLRDSICKSAQISSRWEFGGRIGSAILLLVLPLIILTILISCSKSCSPKTFFDLTTYKSLSQWLSYESLAVIIVHYLIQAFLAVVPVMGTKADRMDNSGSKYYFNAFFATLFTVNALFLLNFLGWFNSNFLTNNYLQLATVSYIFAVIMSIVLYVKSRKLDDRDLNPYGNTGYVVYDFCIGREIHPYIKNLDVKIWFSRIANISSLILTVLFFKHGFILPAKGTVNLTLENYKEFLNKVQLKPTIILYSMMQIIYIFNFVLKEYKITSTFFWQSEGLGYLQIVSSALYPFYFTTISKFVADTELSLPTNALISASVLFVLGFLLMLISNNIKYEFRKDPLQPSLAHLDSMPTFHGKKLLTSSLWGLLRHPNYAGDILIHIAFALPGVLSKQYLASAPALLTIALLVHRVWRDHTRCKRRYGAAWERYCKKVPSAIIPKIF